MTVAPTGEVGSKVHGVLNVITPPSLFLPSCSTTGDVITSLDYAYSVGAPGLAAKDTVTTPTKNPATLIITGR